MAAVGALSKYISDRFQDILVILGLGNFGTHQRGRFHFNNVLFRILGFLDAVQCHPNLVYQVDIGLQGCLNQWIFRVWQ